MTGARLLAVILALVGVALATLGASAGPYDDWHYRTHIRHYNQPGTANLANFPVLVSLNAGNFDFSKAEADGRDIRFADPDGTVLPYEFEKYDSGAQQALIWVRAAQVSAQSAVDFIHMYHGKSGETDAQTPAQVWNNGYAGVWHLNKTGATEPSSTGVHDGSVIGAGPVSAPGAIGEGRLFSADGYIRARDEDLGPGVSSLDAADDISVSYWMRADSGNSNYQRNMAKDPGGGVGWAYQRRSTGDRMDVRIDTDAGNNQVKFIGNTAYDGDWHFIGTTLDSGTWRTYFDSGASSGGYSHGSGFGNTQWLHMGANETASSLWHGTLDEVRVSTVPRSDQWMRAEYRAQSGDFGVATGTRDMTLAPTLMAHFTHEDPANRVRDDTGHGLDAVNSGVAFVAPPTPPGTFRFDPGTAAGFYVGSQSDRLDVPDDELDTAGSFTFAALVNKNNVVMGGHRSILCTERFRFQYSTAGSTQAEREARGRLRLDVNRASPGNDSFYTAEGFFGIDTWYFAALRYDATTNTGQAFLQPASMTLDAPAFSFSLTDPITGLTSWRIGADGLSGIGGFDAWDGYLDGARFYNAWLSDAELGDVLRSYTVPEPATVGLLALGGLGALWRRRRPARRAP